MNFLNKQDIINLLPHREPMLLIDELKDIMKLHSATAIMNVKKDGFYVQGHFPDNPVLPGVLIIEAFGQAAAAARERCGRRQKQIPRRRYRSRRQIILHSEQRGQGSGRGARRPAFFARRSRTRAFRQVSGRRGDRRRPLLRQRKLRLLREDRRQERTNRASQI